MSLKATTFLIALILGFDFKTVPKANEMYRESDY